MVKARKWVLRSHFSGLPKREDFEIVEEELPPLKDGEFLCEAQWLSVDPYMRGWASEVSLGSTMFGAQVAKVTESKNKEYAVGDLLVASFGWRTHTISDGTPPPGLAFGFFKVDPSITLSPSTSLGILGMPGATSYFGFLEICKPKAGETVVVTGATGAVGSAVGQIAKLKGCRVVGFAGSDAKVEYLKSIGFDAAYNYKTISSIEDALKEGCPKGVDMFYDNVGGEFFETVLTQMNQFGRIGVCGAISEYNALEPPRARPVSFLILRKQLKVEGFFCLRWLDNWSEAFRELAQWIQEGKLKYNEHVTDGFDNMFDAFLGLFRGNKVGKAVVKA